MLFAVCILVVQSLLVFSIWMYIVDIPTILQIHPKKYFIFMMLVNILMVVRNFKEIKERCRPPKEI